MLLNLFFFVVFVCLFGGGIQVKQVIPGFELTGLLDRKFFFHKLANLLAWVMILK